ncbi:hypothetical protein AB6F25_12120 [Vibrio splendidus]
MKDYLSLYFESNTFWFFIPLFLILTFFYLAFFIRFVSKDSRLIIFALFLWFSRTLLGYIAPISSFFPNLGDTTLFAKVITDNYLPNDASLGILNYYYLTYFFRLVSMFNVQNFVLIQGFIYVISISILYISFVDWCRYKRIFVSKSTLVVYLVLSHFYPASIIYILVPLREFLIIFALSIFIYGAVKFSIKNDLLPIALGFILIFLVRPQLLPALFCTVYFIKFNSRWYHYLTILIMPIISVYLFSLVFYEITPDKLSYIRGNWSEMHGEQVYGVFQWGNWIDLAKDIPILLLQYMLSPAPILHNLSPFSMKAAFVDLVFLVPIYLMVIYIILKGKKDFLFSPYFIFFVVSLVMSSVWEAYIGGAVRHRLVSIVPLLPIFSYYTLKLRIWRDSM